jgi:hypothetical protein
MDVGSAFAYQFASMAGQVFWITLNQTIQITFKSFTFIAQK